MTRLGAWAALAAVFGGGLWIISSNETGAKLAHGLLLTVLLAVILADSTEIVNGINNLVGRATAPGASPINTNPLGFAKAH